MINEDGLDALLEKAHAVVQFAVFNDEGGQQLQDIVLWAAQLDDQSFGKRAPGDGLCSVSVFDLESVDQSAPASTQTQIRMRRSQRFQVALHALALFLDPLWKFVRLPIADGLGCCHKREVGPPKRRRFFSWLPLIEFRAHKDQRHG